MASNSPVILLVGFDEAGRGPLAGPVSAGAVILPENFPVEILNDSKKLSEKKREKLYDDIKEAGLCRNHNKRKGLLGNWPCRPQKDR